MKPREFFVEVIYTFNIDTTRIIGKPQATSRKSITELD